MKHRRKIQFSETEKSAIAYLKGFKPFDKWSGTKIAKDCVLRVAELLYMRVEKEKQNAKANTDSVPGGVPVSQPGGENNEGAAVGPGGQK